MEALWTIPAMLVITVMSAIAALWLKEGAATLEFKIPSLIKNTRLIAGVLLFTLGAGCYTVLLKYQQLSVLYALGSVTYVWGAVLGKVRLNETIGALKLAGIFTIMLGVTLVGFAS